jgi:hypothetical protein
VFWHGVVISSLPPPLARLAISFAVVCGCAAVWLGVAADADQLSSRTASAPVERRPR